MVKFDTMENLDRLIFQGPYDQKYGNKGSIQVNIQLKVGNIWDFQTNYCQFRGSDQFGSIIVHVYGAQNVSKIKEGSCITVKNACLAPSQNTNQPVLNLNKDTEIIRTANVGLKVKETLLANNISHKLRP